MSNVAYFPPESWELPSDQLVKAFTRFIANKNNQVESEKVEIPEDMHAVMCGAAYVYYRTALQKNGVVGMGEDHDDILASMGKVLRCEQRVSKIADLGWAVSSVGATVTGEASSDAVSPFHRQKMADAASRWLPSDFDPLSAGLALQAVGKFSGTPMSPTVLNKVGEELEYVVAKGSARMARNQPLSALMP